MKFSRRVFRICALGIVWFSLSLSVQSDESVSLRNDEAAKTEPEIEDYDREHWAFLPLEKHAPPDVKNNGWISNSIDRFILREAELKSLSPMPAANKTVLIRRLYFDLIGLPPSPADIQEFLQCNHPNAYEQLVDRLLASPAYGERWGQHWLDLARFAETDGFEHDNLRPNAWRYRDWVVNAINRDVSYDEFIRRQIAGDEMPNSNVSEIIATGFALCGPDMPDINDQSERRHVLLNELTSTVGSVFLGLQIGCAQCHDHKYDPLSQADFYRLRAFFDSSEVFGEHPIGPADAVANYKKLIATYNAQRSSIRTQLKNANDGEAKKQLRDRLARLEREKPKMLHGRVLSPYAKASESRLMVAGDFRRPGPRVNANFPRILESASAAKRWRDRKLTERTDLADWLTQSDHPLVTRVAVNRIWQHFFGKGLVETPADFGVMGEMPSHPELLDWLAREFVRMDWSVKRFQRLILLSSTYRQASNPFHAFVRTQTRRQILDSYSQSFATDPDNLLLTRQNRRRLEAEAIRDSLLACSLQLSYRKGGRGVMPPLPAEIRNSIRRDHWEVSKNPEDHYRRSIYLFVRRNLRYPFLEVFDRPDTNASCPDRDQSTIAPQSLALLNSGLSMDSATKLAQFIDEQTDDHREQIKLAFMQTLGRPPEEHEISACSQFLSAFKMKASVSKSKEAESGLASLCLSLFNLNEFIYVD